MKNLVYLAVAFAFVVGVGALLLTTRQSAVDTETVSQGMDSAGETGVDVAEDGQDPSAPAGSPPPRPSMSTEEFRALGAEVMQVLPKAEAGKSLLPEEKYRNPPLLVAGRELARISEAAANEPALEAEALLLFRECAASPQYTESVRALCFAKYRFLAQKTNSAFDQRIVRKPIRDLGDRLGF